MGIRPFTQKCAEALGDSGRNSKPSMEISSDL